jgi:DinB superfamily
MEKYKEQLQYPIGKFIIPATVSASEIKNAVEIISSFPEMMAEATGTLDANQLNTHYRPGGWTIRQVVHHCADSHINAYVRFKLALTEDHPTIKPYDQTNWAELSDSIMDPAISIAILKGVHARWVNLMETMSDEDWNRTFVHPEHHTTFQLRQSVMNYAWHCEHHLNHIINAKAFMV